MIKVCIFDLDGTLLYTLESIARAGNSVLTHFGLPTQPVDDYRYYCGDGADKLVEKILAKTGDSDPAHYEEGCRINREALEEAPLYRVATYPGMKEALQKLKEKGILLAVCSNKPDAAVRESIEGSFGKGFFDAVQGQDEGLSLKPSPDEPLSVMEKLGVGPGDCLYFGDTGTDMKTGKNAGIFTVGVLWGYRSEEELRENGADRVIRKPEEIPVLLEEKA